MKTTDLMIGDWVFNKYHKKNIQITPFDFFTHGHLPLGKQYLLYNPKIVSGEELEPIPLTTEILEKNGFAKDDKNDNMYYWNWSIMDDCVSYDKETTIFRIFHTLGNLVFVHPLSYIHELQHALKLCNVKLNIEL